ncbi:MAG: hypothetical protein Q9214_005435 [Letrouitia sp. 1 TL-2023]
MRLTVTSCLAFFVAAGLAVPLWTAPPAPAPAPGTVRLAQVEQPKSPEVADLSDLTKRQLKGGGEKGAVKAAPYGGAALSAMGRAGAFMATDAAMKKLKKEGKLDLDKGNNMQTLIPKSLYKRIYIGKWPGMTRAHAFRYGIKLPDPRAPGFMHGMPIYAGGGINPTGIHGGLTGSPYKAKNKE